MVYFGTALIYAAEMGHTSTVSLLLDRGAQIGATDDDGRTALIYAAGVGSVETVQVLTVARCGDGRTWENYAHQCADFNARRQMLSLYRS